MIQLKFASKIAFLPQLAKLFKKLDNTQLDLETLPSFLICTGVLPVYTDKETTGFIEGQKSQQYSDLRHTLEVMGKIATVSPAHKLEEVSGGP